ncbi:MAG: SpoIID/LytB domain-containing protein [Solirubrobacteraceae bacterium]
MGGVHARRARVPATTVVVGAVAALLGGFAVAGPPVADAAEPRLVVRGAGFGHGVGMSQYGAYGLARQGRNSTQILGHYFTGTSVSRLRGARRTRVALQWDRRETTISGAVRIGGRKVSPAHSHRIVRDGPGVVVRRLAGPDGRPRAKRIGRAPGSVRVESGAGLLRVAGASADGVQDGTYRGRIDVVPDGDGLVVVNDLPLEEYVQGVVTGESPSDWPAAALEAQAIAARTYAITTAFQGRPFEQWPDVRSQVYRGVVGESATGNAAVRATAGRVVTLDRRPVTTYYFSTSGGRTEASENVFGGEPRSWLRSVRDTTDHHSPLHRWTRRFSQERAGTLLKVGEVRRVEVLERGDSPRVVRARVVGADGERTVDGGELQRALQLPDRWASFATVSISGCLRAAGATAGAAAKAPSGDATPDPGKPSPGDAGGKGAAGPTATDGAAAARSRSRVATPAGSGASDGPLDLAAATADGALGPVGQAGEGLLARIARTAAARRCRLVGGIRPRPTAQARLQRRDGDRWRTVRRVRLDQDGRFETVVPRGDRWRLVASGFATPSVSTTG